MAYLIDTNVAIHLRDRDPDIVAKITDLGEELIMSVMTRVELEGGVYSDPVRSALRRPRVDTILRTIPALPFDDAAADIYRSILEAVGYSRRKVIDRMIAAQAIAHQATLVTLNGDDFKDVPGLKLLAW